MTVSTTNVVTGPLPADGIVTEFPFTFKIMSPHELLIQAVDGVDETTETPSPDYFVTRNPDGTGKATF